MLMADCIVSGISSANRQGSSETTPSTLTANGDTISIDPQPLRFIVQPSQRRITIIQRRGNRVLWCQSIPDGEYSNAQL